MTSRGVRLAWVVAVALGGGLACGVTSGGGGKDPNARVVPVVVTAAQKQDVPIEFDGLGTVIPLATVTLKSRVDGRLDQVLFKEGQPVKKGDVLAQLDARPFHIQVDQANSTLARDAAQLRNAKLNLERYTGLLAQKLLPQQQVDDQRTLADQAEAVVGIDKAQLENAQLLLEWTRVVSPIDGVTGLRQVDPGNLVRASDPAGLVLITQLDPIAVLFTLPQDVLPQVAEAMEGGPLAVEAYGRDGVTLLASGTLLLIDNQINQSTATMRLKAEFANPKRALWPNQFVKARLKVGVRAGALVVPTPAVQRGPKGPFVYVIGADDTAAMKAIEVDDTEGPLTLVSKGLDPGEWVVTDGQNQLRPGAKVQVKPNEGAAQRRPKAAP
jgi:multidrug efflux system membrane fusion protein